MSDPEGAQPARAPLFRVSKSKKRPYLGRDMLQNASFEISDFNFSRTPLEHKRLAEVCINS